MAQSKPEEQTPFNQVLKLVDQLSPDELAQLHRKINNKSWGERWDALAQKVQEQSKDLPPLSEDEIAEEITAYRREKRAKRAESGS